MLISLRAEKKLAAWSVRLAVLSTASVLVLFFLYGNGDDFSQQARHYTPPLWTSLAFGIALAMFMLSIAWAMMSVCCFGYGAYREKNHFWSWTRARSEKERGNVETQG